MIPAPIQKHLDALNALVEKYPTKIPLTAAAEFLDVNTDGLMAALMRGNTPFGFAYQKQDGGYRVAVIPTATFYLWFNNVSGTCVMSQELQERGRVS